MKFALYRQLPIFPTTSYASELRTVIAVGILCFTLMEATRISSSMAAAPPTIPPGYSAEDIDVKFREGTTEEALQRAVPLHLAGMIARFTRLFSLPRGQLDGIRARGSSLSGRALPDMNQWFRITLRPGTDAAAFLEELRRLPNIEIAEPSPLPQPPPAFTPDFEGNQGYLDGAPGGIHARFSWTLPGGNGSGVTIYDVEYNWLQTHEDLSRASGVRLLLNPGDSNAPPGYQGCPAPCHQINREHGTAVLGEIIADNDTKGVTGISWGANVGLAPANTANLGYNPANAIMLAVTDGAPGDVILIEQQAAVCGLPQYGPLEWVTAVFQAIQHAVAHGLVVVEAAGNGNVNLDQAACGTIFNRTVRDSGAIIVGAGRPPGGGADRQRESFSSYGSRVDLQGWGSGVMTAGYGSYYTNPAAPTNPNYWYTTFSGTSSASPIVAGAIANLQGIVINRFGTPYTPFQMRALLVQTGSPQLGNTVEHIGPRPDLLRAISLITDVLTSLGPASVWVGLKNSDAEGLRLDLLAEVFLAKTKVGQGQLYNVDSGRNGFNNARLSTIPLTLFAPVEVPAQAVIDVTIFVRRTCFGEGHKTGTPRLWYNDSQANSRFGATIAGAVSELFLWNGFTMATTPGLGPKKTRDVPVDSKIPCPNRPFKPFGTWSVTIP